MSREITNKTTKHHELVVSFTSKRGQISNAADSGQASVWHVINQERCIVGLCTDFAGSYRGFCALEPALIWQQQYYYENKRAFTLIVVIHIILARTIKLLIRR